MYDLVIIGAGPAGITAAVYAARKRMNILVITEDIGGQTALSGDIENYTGYQFITGPDLAGKFEEHMRKYKISVREGERVKLLEKTNEEISITTQKAKYSTKSVIIASGKKSRELGVPGEKEFKNRGLTYCATCDGPIFGGKDVAVIGGGNSALDAVLQLMRIARQVYLVNIGSLLSADGVMQEKVKLAANVKIFNDSEVIAVLGDKMVNSIEIKTQGRSQTLTVGGVFVEIGLVPNSEFARGIQKNQYQEIKVNSRNETSLAGIFAAGDVTDVPEKQIVIAAGEGSKAALGAFRYLSRQKG